MKPHILIVAAGLLTLCAVVRAQTTRGSLVGTVLDEGGQPLSGVSVTATSPALQGSASSVTDAAGRFRLLMLPPGTYAATLALDGFQRLEQRDIRIGLEQTITLDVTLPAAFTEEMVVTSESPLVDVTSSTVGADLGPQLIADLPTGRSYQALTYLVAGAVDGGLENNPAILGSSSAENRIVVDELDVTDPQFGLAEMNVSFNFIQEVQVKTGGYQAEYGGALGGVVNMITKSGSNELHGDIFSYYTDDSFEADARLPRQVGDAVTGYTGWDVGFDLGGKIIQDTLWYFVATNPGGREATRVHEILAGDRLVQRNVVDEKLTRNYYAGKLTWQAGTNTSLVASLLGDPGRWEGGHWETFYIDTPYLPTDVTAREETGGDATWSLAFHWIPNEDLLVEGATGRYARRDSVTPRSLDLPAYQDYTTDGRWSSGVGLGVWFGGLYTNDLRQDREQLRLAATWFAGEAHRLKAGVQASRLDASLNWRYGGASDAVCARVSLDFTTNDPGYLSPCDSDGDGTAEGLLIPALDGVFYWLSDEDYWLRPVDQRSRARTDERAIFVQDSWQVTDFLTVDLGLRTDSLETHGNTPYSPRTPGLTNAISLGLREQLQPRVGLVWDFTDDGRSKVFAHYGRTYESIPIYIGLSAFGDVRMDDITFGDWVRFGTILEVVPWT